MPNVDDVIAESSRFISKADVKKPLLLTITKWEKINAAKQNEPADMKYCLRFEEHPKPFVLNITNIKNTAKACGSSDFDDWIGGKIVLYFNPDIEYRGEVTGGIRIRKPKNQPEVEPQVKDDDIPF